MRAADLLRHTSLDNQTLRALVRRGLAELHEEAAVRDPHGDEQFIATSNLELNAEQVLALTEITQLLDSPESPRPILLHGVTGSGKTEIYLQAIRAALERGRSAIVLVPEISLTPQTVEGFKGRFAEAQDAVAVLHSHLSEGERHDEWHKIHSGRARIAIGPRSAVFAPLKSLGLIIVDEEHENSYKQEEAPRYHARDVAIMRGNMEAAVVVLGSATPSLESYYNCSKGKYKLLEMPDRADDKKMPIVRVVDMRQTLRKGKFIPIFSPQLQEGIAQALKRKEDYRRILGDFRAGKLDILLGTQMIAKGLHFPNVTLVGIIYADLSLHQADFRAGERTFQLLTQVAGRAGRGDVEGEVFVQAFTPFHPAIQYARRHDFKGYYEQELEFREQLRYPPVSRIAMLTLKGRNRSEE